MLRKPHLFGAVYGIILNEKGEVLLLKRQNTGYFDGGYVFPAGHIEDGETSKEALIREIKEEVCVDVEMEDIKPVAILHRIMNRQYFDVCYFVKRYSGKLDNGEPKKCSGLIWFAKDNLPDYIAPEIKIFLEHYFRFGKNLKYYTLKQ